MVRFEKLTKKQVKIAKDFAIVLSVLGLTTADLDKLNKISELEKENAELKKELEDVKALAYANQLSIDNIVNSRREASVYGVGLEKGEYLNDE